MNAYALKVAQFKQRHRIGQSRFGKRSYEAGGFNRLTADWQPSTTTGDSEIRFDIESLRNRSREMERNNPLFANWLNVLTANVLKEECGFSLQMKAMNPDGTPDMGANEKIEEAWLEWCMKDYCSETRESSMYDCCELILRSAARDGGFLIEPIIDPGANDFGFTLRLTEIDFLDVSYNVSLPNGNSVVMGIEKNRRGVTVAYHILDKHPGDLIIGRTFGGNRMRIPADQIIHYFVKHRATQCVGVPWGAPPMLKMRHLDKYQEAEVVAAREAAVKGGYFTSSTGAPYAGQDELSQTATGTVKTGTLNDYEPGQSDKLPPGMTFTPYDPTHPTQQFGDFVMAMNIEIAAGLNVSYATLTGDLRGANFSSLRAGRQQEQRMFRKMQGHMIRHFIRPVFDAWLPQAILSGMIRLPFSKLEQFNKPHFSGTRWESVDPQTDATAALMLINGGLTTRSKYCEEHGDDFEDVVAELDYEQGLASDAGLQFANPNTGGVVKNPAAQLAPA